MDEDSGRQPATGGHKREIKQIAARGVTIDCLCVFHDLKNPLHITVNCPCASKREFKNATRIIMKTMH